METKEFEKRVYVRELKEYFDLKQVSGDDQSLDRWIIVADTNRPGLELSGYHNESDLKRVIIIGQKEMRYIEELDYETQCARFEVITDSYTPCIIISAGNKAPKALLDVAGAKNFPIFETDFQTYRMTVDAVTFLDERLAPSDSIHGVMMNIFGIGVLLIGESGIGKSELALELIRRGHSLVADDRVDVSRIHNDIVCSAPELIKGLLEIRGIGIIDVALMFGASSVLEQSELDFVIQLAPFDGNAEYDRVGQQQCYMDLLGVDIPLLKIPVKEGRAMSVIAEAAVTNFRLQQRGVNSNELFNERVMEAMLKQRGE